MLVMNKRGSCGSLNLSKIRSKNKQVCKNAVTRLHGSFVLRVMLLITMDGNNADKRLYTGEMAHYWSLLNTWVSRVTLKLHFR